MNVMEIVSGANVNGAAIHCALLSRELARRGHRVTLVCRPRAWIAGELRSEPIEVVESDLHRIPTDQLRQIAALARERDVHVLHTHQSAAHFFGVLLRWYTHLPSVATAHSRYFQLHWMLNDYVIATSHAAGRYHHRCNFVQNSRLEVIHNFADDCRFSEVPDDAGRQVRRSLGIDPSRVVIGVLGRVMPPKGLGYMISAMPEILAAAPQTQLLVVGSGPEDYLRQLRSLAARLDVGRRITWAGYRSDVPEVMAALDVFVLPSLRESFPLTMLEAMAAGRPVAATDVGGVSECVEPGRTGVLVPPADSRALAEAVVPLLQDRAMREQFGRAGRRRVREHFSLACQVSRIENVLSRFAKRRHAA